MKHPISVSTKPAAGHFNAIQLSDGEGYLTAARISKLLQTEMDPDTVELLQTLHARECRNFQSPHEKLLKQ